MSDHPLLEAARAIAKRLARSDHTAYVAGGAVRDHLLGRAPHDVDVATSARPEEVLALFPRGKHVGASFGVVRVRWREWDVDVATFRTEGPYLDGRHPSRVEYGTAEEDARRRDFTVNGLFLDPLDGTVHDFVGGRRDLERRILRAIGDPRERFAEDHLRLLRAVRFGSQLDFEIEPETRRALEELAPRVRTVAAERVRDELVRLLVGPAAKRGLELMHATGLLRAVLPEVDALEGVPQPPEHHPEGDVLPHTFLLFDHLESPSPELAWGALLHDIGKAPTRVDAEDRIRFPSHAKVGAEMTEEIARRLRLSNDSRERVVSLVANHMRFLDVKRMRTATLKRFLRLPHFEEHLALHRADCLASHRKLDNWRFVRERLEELGEEGLRPELLVSGHDLLEIGWESGPALGRALRALEEMQLEGSLRTREEAIAEARRLLEADPPTDPGSRPGRRDPGSDESSG